MPEGDKFEVAVKNGRWVVTRPRPALGHALLQNAIPIRHATSGIPVARGQGTDHEADDGRTLTNRCRRRYRADRGRAGSHVVHVVR
jgi:hypothetical protein